jgi:hypothetical protein
MVAFIISDAVTMLQSRLRSGNAGLAQLRVHRSECGIGMALLSAADRSRGGSPWADCVALRAPRFARRVRAVGACCQRTLNLLPIRYQAVLVLRLAV